MDNKINGSTNVKLAVPFFMTVNMERSLDFYMHGLGFELKNKWEPLGKIEWCLLQLDDVSLMLQEYRNVPVNFEPGEGVSICFMCEDALKIYEQVTSRGLSPSEPFVGNNLWVVAIADPDGYKIFFESPTDIPEETLYSAWVKSGRK